MTSSLPTSIWNENIPWVPPVSSHHHLYRIEGFTNAVYQAATQDLDVVPHLNLEAPSLELLVDQFSGLIDEAGAGGDYSLILSLVMCQLQPEARGQAKPSQKKPGLIFGLRWLLARPGF